MLSLEFAEDLVMETGGSWKGKHQDKGEILLGSSLAPAQASPSFGSADTAEGVLDNVHKNSSVFHFFYLIQI